MEAIMDPRRLIVILLTVLLAADLAAPLCVSFAAGSGAQTAGYKTAGKYKFTPSTAPAADKGVLEDEFVFDEECFRESSFTGCSHLALLSVQACNASTPFFGDKADKYARDISKGSRNIEGFLSAMGFRNIKVNGYYNRNCMNNSIGAAAGSRKLDVKGRKYTLIALFPRSDGYKQEWCGNFTVGAGDLHQGFREARDELLRFLKKYIKDNGIKGDIKVWTAGHSRGAAVANMTGGFLAGGGAAYLGSGVRLAPQDVFCYTTGTPSSIKPGAAKSEELSVSGPRGGIYKYDTAGEPYEYKGEGTVDLTDKAYGGIRYYNASYDLIIFLPPEQWGFRRYGSPCPIDGAVYGCGASSRKVSEDDMIAVLRKLSPAVYETYINGNKKGDFKWVTLDLKQMKIVEDPSAPEGAGVEDMISARVGGLLANAVTNKAYAESDYQDALVAFGGIFGMVYSMSANGLFQADPSLLKTVVSIYSSYSKERKAAESAAGGGPGAVDSTLVDNSANRTLSKELKNKITPMAEFSKTIYGDDYYSELCGHMQDLDDNINEARRLFTYMLFYSEGEKYSQASSYRNAMTLLSSFGIITTPHFKDVYLSWAKAAAAVTPCEHHTGQAEYDREQERLRKEQEKKNAPKAQKLTIKVSGGKVKASKVKKKNVTGATIKVKKAQGKVTFKKLGGSKRLKISKKTGKITVKRGTKKGKYKIKVRVRAAGNSKFKPASKTVTVSISVK